MSRSIHQTVRELINEDRFDYADSQRQRERLQAIYDQINRKKKTKGQVKKERQRPLEILPSMAPESIPLLVVDQSDFIHYPASPSDLLAVMKSLPAGMLDGLQAIRLCLGRSEQTEDEGLSAAELEADPYTGRCGYEVLRGVFAGRSRGTYQPASSDIRVFAFVYDPTLPDREMWELYLRLDMLSTFMHEVAHHHDLTQRVARGRWIADKESKAERYAEHVEYDLVLHYVVPYLERTYSVQVEALCNWMNRHGGVSVPIASLVRNKTKPRDNALGIHCSVADLSFDVAAGERLTEARLSFAARLRIAGRYKEALAVAETILAEGEKNLEAMALKADLHGRLGELDIALFLAGEVLAEDERFVDAWKVLANVHEVKHDWSNLLCSTTRVLELIENGLSGRMVPLTQRALARLRLGDLEGCEADIDELSQFKAAWIPKAAGKLREEMCSQLGQSDARLNSEPRG